MILNEMYLRTFCMLPKGFWRFGLEGTWEDMLSRSYAFIWGSRRLNGRRYVLASLDEIFWLGWRWLPDRWVIHKIYLLSQVTFLILEMAVEMPLQAFPIIAIRISTPSPSNYEILLDYSSHSNRRLSYVISLCLFANFTSACPDIFHSHPLSAD